MHVECPVSLGCLPDARGLCYGEQLRVVPGTIFTLCNNDKFWRLLLVRLSGLLDLCLLLQPVCVAEHFGNPVAVWSLGAHVFAFLFEQLLHDLGFYLQLLVLEIVAQIAHLNVGVLVIRIFQNLLGVAVAVNVRDHGVERIQVFL